MANTYCVLAFELRRARSRSVHKEYVVASLFLLNVLLLLFTCTLCVVCNGEVITETGSVNYFTHGRYVRGKPVHVTKARRK